MFRTGIAIAALAAMTLSAGLAVAQDKSLPLPAPAGAYSWTGFYAGLNAGGAWGESTAEDTNATNGGCWNSCGFEWTADVDGFVGGGQAGYNWQFGHFVFGAEADVGYLGVDGSEPASISPDTIVNTDGGLYATARGRVGLALDRFLVFGTGGWIGADLNSSVNDNLGGGVVNTAETGFQSGWTAGGGIEVAFGSRWSIKADWLHYDLGDEKVGGVCCGGGVIQYFKIDNSGDIVRAGANIHF